MRAKPRLIRPTSQEDAAINRGIAQDLDSPEWSEEDFRTARPASEAVPEVVADYVRRTRGPQRAPTKALVSLRVDRDVIDRLRASGRGWQARANAALRRAVLGE